jgi:hypothetical protein
VLHVSQSPIVGEYADGQMLHLGPVQALRHVHTQLVEVAITWVAPVPQSAASVHPLMAGAELVAEVVASWVTESVFVIE